MEVQHGFTQPYKEEVVLNAVDYGIEIVLNNDELIKASIKRFRESGENLSEYVASDTLGAYESIRASSADSLKPGWLPPIDELPPSQITVYSERKRNIIDRIFERPQRNKRIASFVVGSAVSNSSEDESLFHVLRTIGR